jgi:hypothetical protein
MKRTGITQLLTVTALAVFGAVLSSNAIWAQTPPPADTLKVNYFSNANTAGAPDATVRITNPGSSGGNVCANIYVTDPSQEVLECCSCTLTPNGLRTLSVNNDLAHNPLTPGVLTAGTIQIISSVGSCNPAKVTPASALRAWGTHIQMPAGFGPFVTETEFLDATLSSTEVGHLVGLCGSIVRNGSGYGMCSCGSGD